ncbi:MAG TPA: hypothetical protein VFW24_01350 [Acidimicrobiales bacterium]|nr:hypothetical protein [Acidimicrobiales bacterium]
MADEPALPDTPAGRQAEWFLRHTRTKGRDLTVEEIRDHQVIGETWTAEDSLARFREADDRPFRMGWVKEASPHAVEIHLDYGDDRPFNLTVEVEEDPPHLIGRIFFARAIPEDIVIRPAQDSDGAALNDLEVRAPMQLGDGTLLTYDRGPDFLGFGRLMGNNICFVAERDGHLLGLACGASHRVRIGGRDHTVMLLHHLRVPVEHRKGGIFSSLNNHVFGAFHGRTDAAYGYTSLDNPEAMRIGGPGTWSVTVYRMVLDCPALAGPAHGRVATPADATLVADILNRAHDAEEAYLPHTAESFSERMQRAPELYSWDQVLVGDGAVLGVWLAGIRLTSEHEGRRRLSTRAVVLDHGFAPGAGEEQVALLRSWAARLVELGHTEMTLVTSESSPAYPVVAPLAAKLDPFAYRMAVPEPEGTGERGVYVDAIYF